jgi:hypothetical protein
VDLNRVAERVESRVESLSAASAGFVVGLGGHESDQLVQVVAGGGQDGMVGVGRIPNTTRSQSASSNRNPRNAAATSSEMTISLTGPARVSRRLRRSKGESAQLLMMPSSSQTLDCHRTGPPARFAA